MKDTLSFIIPPSSVSYTPALTVRLPSCAYLFCWRMTLGSMRGA